MEEVQSLTRRSLHFEVDGDVGRGERHLVRGNPVLSMFLKCASIIRTGSTGGLHEIKTRHAVSV